MNSEVIIRKGNKEDVEDMHRLVSELALFEKAPEQVTNTVAEMIDDGFGKNPCYNLLVAESGKTIIGIAIYFTKYSTWKGKGVYLDDLYVTDQFRGKGIGKKLFDAVINEARKINAKQLHWQVLDWNTAAINFYKKYDAGIDSEWLDCKIKL